MEEHPPPPPGWPGDGPPPGTPTSKGSGLRRVRLRNPLSIVLIAVIVIGFLAAGLLASELYARHLAESVVAAATECVVQDKASVSFGATPLLLQLATGAETGRCAARRRATITACPVWWDGAAKAIAARLRRSIASSAVRERRVGSPPELPPLHQTATPCDQRAELTAFRTGCC